MQKYRSSKRGLTFSIDPEEKYYPGSHYIYEVRKNCIIIRPSDNGMTVSRKNLETTLERFLTFAGKKYGMPWPIAVIWKWK